MNRKVLLINPYDKTDQLFRQSPRNSHLVSNLFFEMNKFDGSYDYVVVFEDLPNELTVDCKKGGLILCALESPSINLYNEKFLAQFDVVISCQENLKHKKLINDLTTTFWRVQKSFDELIETSPFPKMKKVSIISSNKTQTVGHRKRLEFALKVKAELREDIDLFGRGINDFDDKWDTLAPYKYSIVLENEYYPNWLTEKFSDCLLTYTYPIYYGCPNAEKYFDESAFTRIDINDYNTAIKTIKRIIYDDNFYKSKLSSLEIARTKFLFHHNIFFKIASIVESLNASLGTNGHRSLRQQNHYGQGVFQRLLKRALNG